MRPGGPVANGLRTSGRQEGSPVRSDRFVFGEVDRAPRQARDFTLRIPVAAERRHSATRRSFSPCPRNRRSSFAVQTRTLRPKGSNSGTM
jgi:hypothetical protein